MSDESIFAAALAISSPSRRSEYLEQACGGNPNLRRDVDALLAAHAADNPLDRPSARAPQLAATCLTDSNLTGTTIAGRYKLLEQIGDGGMGTVWMAEQRAPVKRLVAVKLIKPGMDSKGVLARFEAERQALAMMDHPNIAKVLDAGTGDDGRPFFVMELVKGLPLTEYCDARRLPVNDRLDLFVQICSAVQHAHQKAVIHRDLKPSNVLVTEHDGKPVPKVIDFGLAKALGTTNVLTDRTLHTAYGTVVGTPLYMAPEQVGINALDVDTRTDIYALGVILYELLTGSTPLERARFKEAAWEEVKRLIRDEEPPRPSTRLSSDQTLPSLAASRQVEPAQLRRLVRGDLDWIVMKALEKDRSRRYDTANGLAKDVQRYQKGDAVEACPPTLGYRLRKAYRRNRVAVLVGGTIATVLLLATGVSLAFGVLAKRSERRAIDQEQVAAASAAEANRSKAEAKRERDVAVASKEYSARVEYARSIQLADSSLREYKASAARRILDSTRPDLRGWEWRYLNRLCQSDYLYDLRKPFQRLDASKHESMGDAKFSTDGKFISITTWTYDSRTNQNFDSVQVLDASTRKERYAFHEILRSSEVPSGSFKRAVLGPDDKLLVVEDDHVQFWDVATKTRSDTLKAERGETIWSVAHRHDGKRIATTGTATADDGKSEQVLKVWNAETKEALWQTKAKDSFRFRAAQFDQHNGWLMAVEEQSVTAEQKNGHRKLMIWDAETGADLLDFSDPEFYTAPISASLLQGLMGRETPTADQDGL